MNKFLEDMNPEAAKEMGRVDVTIIALKSFISSTLAETRKETVKEIKGIIEEEAKKLSKQVGAGKSWDIALIRVSDILSVLKEKK